MNDKLITYQISIEGNQDFWSRTIRSFFYSYFVFILIYLLFEWFLNSIDMQKLKVIIFFSGVVLIVCFFFNKKILYRITFSTIENNVKIEVLKFNKVTLLYPISLEDFKVEVRKDLLSMFTPWVMKLYDGKKLILKQAQQIGWTYDNFIKVENVYKEIKQNNK